jgi:hypothetical protein
MMIKSRRARWTGHVACVGKCKMSESDRPLRRTRQTWKDDVKMDREEVGCESVDQINLTQDREQQQDL